MRLRIGYCWLADSYQLPIIDLWQQCYIDSAARGRQEQQDLGTHRIQLFETRYQPEDTLVGHLQFALRYEGLNLQVLSLLFETADSQQLCEWLSERPTSAYARRAAAFLYLKETQSSFEVEREKPSASRAQRFADLLRQADIGQPLTKERLVELQNAVIDPRFHEFGWRQQQNWIGDDLGYRQRVEFVPARPEDVPVSMQGLLDTAAKASFGKFFQAAAATYGLFARYPGDACYR